MSSRHCGSVPARPELTATPAAYLRTSFTLAAGKEREFGFFNTIGPERTHQRSCRSRSRRFHRRGAAPNQVAVQHEARPIQRAAATWATEASRALVACHLACGGNRPSRQERSFSPGDAPTDHMVFLGSNLSAATSGPRALRALDARARTQGRNQTLAACLIRRTKRAVTRAGHRPFRR